LATEAQRLVEVAKTQRQSAEAKVGVPQMRQEGLTMPMDDAMYVKMGGISLVFWMVYKDLTM